jgi:hypothetical protein
MLDLELDLHAVPGALLDSERLGLQVFQLAGLAEINDDVWATIDLAVVRLTSPEQFQLPLIVPQVLGTG